MFWTLERTAAVLNRRSGAQKVLPPLMFFTDPERTPDIAAVAARLPPGSAIVLRTFGAADSEVQARKLAQVARRRRLTLLIGADTALAARVGAQGVHLPERLAHRAGPLRRAHPGWIVTTAAHSLRAARGTQAHACVVSAIFPSRSPSAGAPLGAMRLARIAKAAGRPVYALGGVNARTARRLLGVRLAGLAAVDGLRT
jgi:thiamine-phosphate pyrophosphorylase